MKTLSDIVVDKWASRIFIRRLKFH